MRVFKSIDLFITKKYVIKYAKSYIIIIIIQIWCCKWYFDMKLWVVNDIDTN
jgi:hypothetical protein